MIVIPRDMQTEMVAHAIRGLPNEACGLVAASDGRVERFYPMRNADESPLTYRLDPKDQLEVFDEIERKGWELFGIFHSHTHTEAFPSETDRRQAFYPEAYYLLLSLADHEHPVLRGFAIRDDAIVEQEVRIA